MDRYLFESFVFELENEEVLFQSLQMFAKQSENIVEREGNDKVTFNYYPQKEKRLQLVVEGKRNKDGLSINYMKVHHTSPDIWKLKVINPLSDFDDCYMASREDGSGCVIIRLVNKQVLGEIKSGDILEAQVVGMALVVDIFENEEEYSEKVPKSKDGQKYFMGDGTIIPTNLIVNNNTKFTEKERKEKDHSFDNLVDFKGTIKLCFKYPLHMYGMDVNNYYIAQIATEYGDLHVVIPQPMMPEGIKGFGVGNVIVGKILLSGDVCINEYEKYVKELH